MKPAGAARKAAPAPFHAMARKLAPIFLVALFAALPLAGWSLAGESGGLQVSLGDRSVEPSSRSVRPGPVTIETRNHGRADHDLLVLRTERRADDLPVGLGGVKPSLAGTIVLGEEHDAHEHASKGSRAHHLGPGESRRRRVVLQPGRYVLLCPLPGHYQAGQRAELLVEP